MVFFVFSPFISFTRLQHLKVCLFFRLLLLTTQCFQAFVRIFLDSKTVSGFCAITVSKIVKIFSFFFLNTARNLFNNLLSTVCCVDCLTGRLMMSAAWQVDDECSMDTG